MQLCATVFFSPGFSRPSCRAVLASCPTPRCIRTQHRGRARPLASLGRRPVLVQFEACWFVLAAIAPQIALAFASLCTRCMKRRLGPSWCAVCSRTADSQNRFGRASNTGLVSGSGKSRRCKPSPQPLDSSTAMLTAMASWWLCNLSSQLWGVVRL